MIPTIVKDIAILTAKELIALYKRKRAKDKAQQEYAETPVTPQGCPKCKEIAYSPGQMKCYKCNAVL
jgi:hypothetical protein